jgi:hypothetical protein
MVSRALPFLRTITARSGSGQGRQRNLVKDLRGGRILTHDTHVRIVAFMRGYHAAQTGTPVSWLADPEPEPGRQSLEGRSSNTIYEGSQALLRALWREHRGIMRFAKAAGLNVEEAP